MPRYVALLRGVSPMNAKMADLRAAFEDAGFTNVATVLASGNVVFDARAGSRDSLARKCEKAMAGAKVFKTIVRSLADLESLLASDPFGEFELAKNLKRVVTFLREPPSKTPDFPLRLRESQILCVRDSEIFSTYVPGNNDPAFMQLIERTFGKDLTTRTWDTVKKIVKA